MSSSPHCYLVVDEHDQGLGRDASLTWCFVRARRHGKGARVINCESGEVVHVEE